jgi:hypothetical protein
MKIHGVVSGIEEDQIIAYDSSGETAGVIVKEKIYEIETSGNASMRVSALDIDLKTGDIIDIDIVKHNTKQKAEC